MTDIHQGHTALGDVAARALANATKTVPQLRLITPRWFVHLLHWVPVEAGIYRVNKVKDADRFIKRGEYRGRCTYSRFRSLQQPAQSDS